MIKEIANTKAKAYLKNNWFKLGFIVFLLFVTLKKDLSFNFNLNTPVKLEESRPKQSLPVHESKKKKKKETYSENRKSGQSFSGSPSPVFERLDIASIGGEGKPRLSASAELAAVDEVIKIAYMERFAHVAVSERKKYGIPSSIILATALLQSKAGTRDMAKQGNNHFAIPCTSDWQGEVGSYQNSCYRHYENAWTSFRDHSRYITTGSFSQLRQLGSDDYKAWAKGLENLGYSEEGKLSKQLTELIGFYELYELDEL